MARLPLALLATGATAAVAALAPVPASSRSADRVPSSSPRAAATGAYDQYLAPPGACPGSDDLTLLASEQVGAVLCLIDYARAARGLGPLARSPLLASSAAIKADDIVRCDDFSHTACGRSVNAPFEDSGYVNAGVTWDVGENLAYGKDLLGSPRAIMRAWLESDGHRENLFTAYWADQGVAMRKPPALLGLTATVVWVSHFGRRQEVAAGGGGGAGDGGGPPPGAGSGSAGDLRGLRLTVRPGRVRSGRRTAFRFLLTSSSAGRRRGVARATISFAGQRARTDARGRAALTAVLRGSGLRRAVVRVGRSARASATVRVVR